MKKLICFTSVLAFLCAALSGCVSIEFNGLYAQTPEVTDSSRTPQLETPGTVVLPTETPAPVPVSFDFDTVDLDGNAVNTREFAAEHELTLVNFWATWCGPCVGEMPELQSLHERFSTEAAETDVAILGVWLDTERTQGIWMQCWNIPEPRIPSWNSAMKCRMRWNCSISRPQSS